MLAIDIPAATLRSPAGLLLVDLPQRLGLSPIQRPRCLPFLAVRVIADQANDELVQSGAMKDDGSFDQAAFGAFISEHPELMPVVSRQMECSRLALAALTQFANAFLPRLAELAAGRAA